MEPQTPPVFPRKQVIALVIAFLICFLIVVFNGCKKGDDTSPDGFTTKEVTIFFRLPVAAPPQLQVVATALR